MKRPHRKVVGTAVMDGKLFLEIIKRKEGMAGIKAFLILTMAALHISIVAWCIRADQPVADAQLSSGFLKKGGNIPLAVGETVGKLGTVVRLDTLHADSPAGIPLHQTPQEVGGGVGGLLRIGGKETRACELVDSGILKQT